MKHEPKDSQALQDWLDKATTENLNEEACRSLLDALPKDPGERAKWLDQLRVSHALVAQTKPEVTGSLNQILNSTPSHQKGMLQSYWLRVAATLILSFGFLGLAYSIITTSSNLEEKISSDMIVAHRNEEQKEPYQYSSSPPPIDSDSRIKNDEGDNALLVDNETEEAFKRNDSQEFKSIAAKPQAVRKIIEDVSQIIEASHKSKNLETLANAPASSLDNSRLMSKESSEKLATVNSVATLGLQAKKVSASVVHSRLARSYAPSEVLSEAPTSPKGEQYVAIAENNFIVSEQDAKSTFSIDVDTASYANIRRMIRDGQLPNPDAVRVEEMINTFRYDYEPPRGEEPFSVHMDQTPAPWHPEHRVVRIGLKGKIDAERPPVNLVFLLDVSGSMNNPDKLPLLKRSFSMLLNGLGDGDKVSIVAYAGHTGVVLEPTPATDRQKILKAMNQLRASGSTNGAGGIQLAYDLAKQSLIKDGVNRVILATDGDFNVGISDRTKLISFIEEKRRTGIELSVLGFGRGNIRDDVMENLANKGNGNYSYIDSVREARKALVEELNSNLVTIAKDVKIQVEFNPRAIKSFRLIGYENRKLAHRDFADDTKDAGEIGMGHSVTALYELIPTSHAESDAEILTLNLRHKKPGGTVSQLQQSKLHWKAETEKPSTDFQWALSVATWGQLLRGSDYLGKYSPQELLKMARESRGDDAHGYRAEMIQLIESWMDLGGKTPTSKLPKWEYRK
jgi:Ca-activated chloride channel homolog